METDPKPDDDQRQTPDALALYLAAKRAAQAAYMKKYRAQKRLQRGTE